MNLISLLQILFPTPYSRELLEKIPRAPEPIQKNIFSLYDYHHPRGKKLIYYIKQHSDIILEKYIAQNISEYMSEYFAEQNQYSFFINPIIIPVPLTRKQKRKRGFNQVSLLSKHLAYLLGGIYRNKYIIKHKETYKQALLPSKHERLLNVRDCFDVPKKYREKIIGKDIIIIDDLITTGATLEEIQKTLIKYKVRNIIAITIAH